MSNTKKKFGFLLFPLSLIYALVVGFRHWLFNCNLLKSHEFPIPIISVGNITVGGTGKTPHVEYLVNMLKDEYQIATLSRGYKRKSCGFVEADQNSTSSDIGDEPMQIFNNNKDVTIAVCESRVRGIKKILSDISKKIQIIILDDAFQHRYVKPGISILLMDYNRPIWEDSMLPYGNLREREHHKYRANIIIVTKLSEELKPIQKRILEKDLKLFPYQQLYFTTIKYKKPLPLYPKNDYNLDFDFENNKYNVLLITGIANPDELLKYIKKFSLDIKHLAYKDHFIYKTKDGQDILDAFKNIQNPKVVITTEKDSIRIKEITGISDLEKLPIFYIPIEIDFLYNEKEKFNNQIKSYVRKNKPISSIYSERSGH